MHYNHIIIVILSSLLLGCSGADDNFEKETESSADLDQAAINAGILPDPDNIILEGRFETRSDIGIDKFCAIKTDDNDYSVGILAVFGADSHCEGRGNAVLQGENLIVTLDEAAKNIDENCEFTAIFDGISLQLPGELPLLCAKFCNNRASLSGTQYFLTDEGNDNARGLEGKTLKPLCKN